MPKEILLISGLGIGILFSIYFCIMGILSFRANEEYQQLDQFEALQKAEKASYLMMRKYFSEIEERLTSMEQQIGIPTDEIINAQKKITKMILADLIEKRKQTIQGNK